MGRAELLMSQGSADERSVTGHGMRVVLGPASRSPIVREPVPAGHRNGGSRATEAAEHYGEVGETGNVKGGH